MCRNFVSSPSEDVVESAVTARASASRGNSDTEDDRLIIGGGCGALSASVSSRAAGFPKNAELLWDENMLGGPAACMVFALRRRYFSVMDSNVLEYEDNEDEPPETNDGNVTFRGSENDGSENVSVDEFF